ncbi:MAG: rod shape-determining protein RodA, partial [Bacteroidota bacterium]|nr:rod shape-determining protein RodA [Bacteroidota bacterium]
MSNRRINIWVNIDWSIIGLYLVLVLLGWVNIYSVEYNEETSGIFDLSHRYGKQLLWIILALVLAFIFVIIDTNFYVYFAYPLYIFMMVLLIAVLFLGKEIHGAKSWFAIGGFQFQPSEFAKFITGLALARFLSSTNTNLKSFRHIFQSFSILLIPAILIILQPDTGSSLVYASLAIVLFREGLPGIYVIIGLSM